MTQFVLDALALSDIDRQHEIAAHRAVMAAIGHPDGLAPAFTAVGKRRLLLAAGGSAGQRRLDLQPPLAKSQGVDEIVDLAGADGVGGRLGIPFECDTVGVADVTIGADMDDQGRNVFSDQLMLLKVVPQRLFRFRAQPPLPRQTLAESGDQQIEPSGDQAVVQRIVLPAGQKPADS